MGKRFKQALHKSGHYTTNKHVNREIKMKTLMAKMKKFGNTQYWQESVEHFLNFYTFWWECKLVEPLLECFGNMY